MASIQQGMVSYELWQKNDTQEYIIALGKLVYVGKDGVLRRMDDVVQVGNPIKNKRTATRALELLAQHNIEPSQIR